MTIKIAEKKLALGIICIVTALLLLANTTLLAAPVRVSEKGLLLTFVAFVLLAAGGWSFKRAVVKQ